MAYFLAKYIPKHRDQRVLVAIQAAAQKTGRRERNEPYAQLRHRYFNFEQLCSTLGPDAETAIHNVESSDPVYTLVPSASSPGCTLRITG
jgi:hypothetical protein